MLAIELVNYEIWGFAMAAKAEYGNESISTSKGRRPCQKRRGRFLVRWAEGCEHSVFEILSNAIDEARQGYGKGSLPPAMPMAAWRYRTLGVAARWTTTPSEQRYQLGTGLLRAVLPAEKYDGTGDGNYEYAWA